MRNFLFIFSTTMLLSGCFGTSSIIPTGKLFTTQTSIPVTASKITVRGGIELTLDNTLPEGVLEITAHENIHPLLLVETTDNSAEISLNTSKNIQGETVKVRTAPNGFNNLSAKGGAQIISATPLKNTIEVNLSGGAHCSAPLQTSAFTANLSGGSWIRIRGNTAQFFANCSGGSHIDATQLSCEKASLNISGGSRAYGHNLSCYQAEVNLSGGSHFEATIENKIEANASGGSHICIYGNPPFANINTSGGATFYKKEQP